MLDTEGGELTRYLLDDLSNASSIQGWIDGDCDSNGVPFALEMIQQDEISPSLALLMCHLSEYPKHMEILLKWAVPKLAKSETEAQLQISKCINGRNELSYREKRKMGHWTGDFKRIRRESFGTKLAIVFCLICYGIPFEPSCDLVLSTIREFWQSHAFHFKTSAFVQSMANWENDYLTRFEGPDFYRQRLYKEFVSCRSTVLSAHYRGKSLIRERGGN